MGALCAVTAIISVVVPFAAGLALLGTVPMGLLAYRYRLRVLVAATVAAGMIAFLIAGLGGFMAVVNSAYIGGLTGFVKRTRRGMPTVIVTSLVAGCARGPRQRCRVGRADPAAVPDLQSDDRRRGRDCLLPDLDAYAGGRRP